MAQTPAGGETRETDRFTALETLRDLGPDRLSVAAQRSVGQVHTRIETRRSLSTRHTVVALAGGTGSGKSSLFNAIAGIELSEVSSRRPTTAVPYACLWGLGEHDNGSEKLLDWLEVPEQQRVWRESQLDADDEQALRGLILVDLPDYDSTSLTHRGAVDRLVSMVDLLVWVLDPQKYADNVLHENYLCPLAGHEDTLLVVLNQVDRLDAAQTSQCLGDLRKLLRADGLSGARLLPTSAVQGLGVAELRSNLQRTVAARDAAQRRLDAELDEVGELVEGELGSRHRNPARPVEVGRSRARELLEVGQRAAGVPATVERVYQWYLERSRRFSSFPPRAVTEPEPPRQELRGGRAVVRGELLVGARDLGEQTASDYPLAWRSRLADAAQAQGSDLVAEVEQAVTEADSELFRPAPWWRGARLGAITATLGLIVGVVGLIVGLALLAFVNAKLGVGIAAAAAVVLLVSLVAGMVIASRGRSRGRREATERAQLLEQRLREAVGTVLQHRVVEPVQQELDNYNRLAKAAVALRSERD